MGPTFPLIQFLGQLKIQTKPKFSPSLPLYKISNSQSKNSSKRENRKRETMSTCSARTRVGRYELGRTLGEGSFAKVKFARDSRSGDGVAIKILDKSQVLKHKMVEQVIFFSFLYFLRFYFDFTWFGCCHWWVHIDLLKKDWIFSDGFGGNVEKDIIFIYAREVFVWKFVGLS